MPCRPRRSRARARPPQPLFDPIESSPLLALRLTRARDRSRPAGDQLQWGYYESEPLTQLRLALDDMFEPVYPTLHSLARAANPIKNSAQRRMVTASAV